MFVLFHFGMSLNFFDTSLCWEPNGFSFSCLQSWLLQVWSYIRPVNQVSCLSKFLVPCCSYSLITCSTSFLTCVAIVSILQEPLSYFLISCSVLYVALVTAPSTQLQDPVLRGVGLIFHATPFTLQPSCLEHVLLERWLPVPAKFLTTRYDAIVEKIPQHELKDLAAFTMSYNRCSNKGITQY